MKRTALLPIGDELLSGNVIDTNSAWIAGKLFLEGLPVVQKICVGDDKPAILKGISTLCEAADIIILTGGLGPTRDDVTKKVLLEWSNSHWIRDEATYERIRKYMEARGRTLNELNASQAEVPSKAIVLPNYQGTAPGLWLEKEGKVLISLPGVPYEMKALMEQQVLPLLREKYSDQAVLEEVLLVAGIPESELALILKNTEDLLPPEISIAYLPEPGQVKVKFRITVPLTERESGHIKIRTIADQCARLLGLPVYGRNEDTPESVIYEMLHHAGKTLALAESCTGGNIGGKLVQVPGISSVLLGGLISYSNEMKIRHLGVPKEIIEKYGAVSEPVALAMAEGARKISGADYGLAVTGIAGPEGGSPEKPVGTVWIGVSSQEGTEASSFLFENNRQRNIQRAVLAALMVLRKKHLSVLGKAPN